jgi:hypothetical protein
VELSKSARKISLKVCGPLPQNFFTVLMHTMDTILKRFPGLEIERRIPCICHLDENKKEPCKRFYLYEDLIRRYSAGKMFVECPDSFRDVSVTTMLYGIHPSTQDKILKELIELKEQHARINRDQTTKINQMTELLNRSFTKTYNLIVEQDYRCPNVFLLKPKNRNKWDPRNLFSEPYVMQLYCQSPQGWHATAWEKEINKTREWWLKLYPLLSSLMEMMKFATPIVKAISPVGVPETILTDFNNNLEIMKEFTNKLPEVGFSKEIELMYKDIDSRPNEAVDSALRILYYLLDEIDPVHEWGGLAPVFTPDGNLLWLCSEHKKEYLSPTLEI